MLKAAARSHGSSTGAATERTGRAPPKTYDVRKNDQTGGDALVESSPDIDPDSLGLNESTLTWTRAGEPRSATLD